jgi:hypothetical protein
MRSRCRGREVQASLMDSRYVRFHSLDKTFGIESGRHCSSGRPGLIPIDLVA